MKSRKIRTYVIGSLVLAVVLLLAVYLVLILSGVISVKQRRITVSVYSVDKVYDGTPLYAGEGYIADGVLKDGHKAVITSIGEQTNVGSSESRATVTILDENKTDVTKEYSISYVSGSITVTPIRITVYSGSADKKYDGTPLTCSACGLENGELLDGHKLVISTNASLTYIGKIDNKVLVKIVDRNGKDVSEFYEIEENLGTLLVSTEGNIDQGGGGIGGSDQDGGSGSGGQEGDGTDGGSGSGSGSGSIDPNDPDLSEGDSGFYDKKSLVLIINSNISGTIYLKVAEYFCYDEVTGNWDETNYSSSTSISSLTNMERVKGSLEDVSIPANVKIKEIIPQRYACIPYYAYNVPEITEHEYNINYFSYDFTEQLKYMPVEDLSGMGFEFKDYLSIDDDLRSELLKVIEENNLDENIAATALWLRGLDKYDENFSFPEGEDKILYFLTNEDAKGVCRHFATAAVMLYRAMGIPAKYCVGYVGETEADKDVEIAKEKGHAWVEIYVNGEWIQLEVTGGNSGGGDQGGGDKDEDDQCGEIGGRPGGIALNNSKQGSLPSHEVVFSISSNITGTVYLKARDCSYYDFEAQLWKVYSARRANSQEALSEMSDTANVARRYGIEKGCATIYRNGYNVFTIPTYASYNFAGILSGDSYSVEYYAGGLGRYYKSWSVQDAVYVKDDQMAKYLQISPYMKEELWKIIEDKELDGDLFAAARYISSMDKYNYLYKIPDDVGDEILWFLTDESAEGVCAHFARATAIMYRALGIPARYCVGFVADTVAGEVTDVTADRAHAWVELFIDGHWIMIDTTGGGNGGITNDDDLGQDPVKEKQTLDLTVARRTKIYDGEEAGFEISSVRGLLTGHKAVIEKKYKNVGNYSLYASDVRVLDENDNDVTKNYKVNASVIAKDALVIEAREITIKSKSANKTYDGAPLTCKDFEIISGSLVNGDIVFVEYSSSQILPGTAENVMEKIKICDKNGNDVTTNYKVKTESGVLTVYPPAK